MRRDSAAAAGRAPQPGRRRSVESCAGSYRSPGGRPRGHNVLCGDHPAAASLRVGPRPVEGGRWSAHRGLRRGTLLGSFPGGWLAARYGPKRATITGLVLMSVSGLAFGFGKHIEVLDAARFVQGVGSVQRDGSAELVGRRVLRGPRKADRLGDRSAILGVVLGPALGGVAVVLNPEIVFSGVTLLGLGLCWWASTIPAPSPGESRERLGARHVFSRPLLMAFCLVCFRLSSQGWSRSWCRCDSTNWERQVCLSVPHSCWRGSSRR